MGRDDRLTPREIKAAEEKYDRRHKRRTEEKQPDHDPQAQIELAKWRREGHGVWHVTVVVEGFDDEFVYLYPGKLSKTFVRPYARMIIARQLKCSPFHVHVKHLKKEP